MTRRSDKHIELWQYDKTLRKFIVKMTKGSGEEAHRERSNSEGTLREGHQGACYQRFYGMKQETVTLPVM